MHFDDPVPDLPDSPLWLKGLDLCIDGLGRWGTRLLSLGAGLLALVVLDLATPLTQADLALRNGLVGAVLVMLMSAGLGHTALQVRTQLDASRLALDHERMLDPLTGLKTRRQFIQCATRDWSLARRHRQHACMLMLDVDLYRQLSVDYGADCADAAVSRIAAACATQLRGGDIAGRFASKELIMFLPQTDPLGAVDLAERLRVAVAALQFSEKGQAIALSVSIGVAALRPDHRSLDQLILDADAALFSAKTAGCNCVRGAAGLLQARPSRAIKR